MSRETLTHLNTMTLIGFTSKRGQAWHYKAELQGEENNHYDGAIPVEDVQRRLFNWHALEGSVKAEVVSEDGVLSIVDPERKSIVRPPGSLNEFDKGAILGLFKSGYLPHQYDEWLLNQVAQILDDELSIGSAGLLKGGAQAWVQVEVPDSITTPSGVEFRPHLLAATSLDGSLATIFKRTVTNTVCDNTMAAALGEISQQFKVKHSRYSNAKLGDIRNALDIVYTTAEDFTAQVEQLTNIAVTDDQFAQFLESLAPRNDEDGALKEGRAYTVANNKQATLQSLWQHDDRVTPWRNTAFGVVQAVNTLEHHLTNMSLSGAQRGQRNMSKALGGDFDRLDRESMNLLTKVLG